MSRQPSLAIPFIIDEIILAIDKIEKRNKCKVTFNIEKIVLKYERETISKKRKSRV